MNRFDPGLSLIFDSHAGEFLEIEGLGRVKPDRVYGLRRTNRFRRILDEIPGKDDQKIGDIVTSSPFQIKYEQLLFPFLVLEAKSEKSASSMSRAEIQTASALRELLILQRNLKDSAGTASHWKSGPLAWCLVNKGEHWSVSAAYLSNPGSHTPYVSLLLKPSIEADFSSKLLACGMGILPF